MQVEHGIAERDASARHSRRRVAPGSLSCMISSHFLEYDIAKNCLADGFHRLIKWQDHIYEMNIFRIILKKAVGHSNQPQLSTN